MKKILSVFTACVILLTLLGGFTESAMPLAVTESTAVTPSDVIDAAEEIELSQAERFGLPTEKVGQRTLSGREFMELADAFVKFVAPDKLAAWKNEFTAMRGYDDPIYRYDAIAVLYHAGQLIGGEYAVGGEEGWTDYIANAAYFNQTVYEYGHHDLLNGYETDTSGNWIDSYFPVYNHFHKSKVSGRHPFYCNPDNCSFDFEVLPSYADGVLAILRLIGSVQPELFDADLFPFDKPDPGIFDDELYEKMALYPEVTTETMPRWTGKIIGIQEEYFSSDVEYIRDAKKWGFNAVRISLLPDVYDEKWERLEDKGFMLILDQMIAEAIKLGLHVEIWCKMHPGLWEHYVAEGDFATMYHCDRLYGEKYYQDLNDEVWRQLAERYKDVPSACLTMLPMQENYYINYNTDFFNFDSYDWAEYTPQDVADYQARLVDVIHEVDPDRIVFVEPGYLDYTFDSIGQLIIDAMKGKPNTAITFNYPSAGAYGLYSMNFNKSDVDNFRHSSPVLRYPFCLYDAHEQVTREYPIKIGGFLPAGTEITLYVKKTEIDEYLKSIGIKSGALSIVADGKTLYTEQISDAEYKVEESISGHLTYAESEKKITVTLPNKTDSVEIQVGSDLEYTWPYDRYDNGIRLHWSGLKVHLPEEYAVDQLWNATAYDVSIGIAEADEPGIYVKHTSDVLISPIMEGYPDCNWTHDITINEDITYTTPYPSQITSYDTLAEAASQTAAKCVGWLGSFRTESSFNLDGRYWEDIKAFMTDTYDVMYNTGLSWWSVEIFHSLFTESSKYIDRIEPVEEGRFKAFYPQVLEILQKYMAPGWCEFSAEADGKGSVAGSQMIIAGGSATLTAVPDDGAEFFGWYLDGKLVSSEPRYTVTVNADTKLVAKFTPTATPGDVDNNGKITLDDAILTLKRAMNVGLGDAVFIEEAADVVADGKISLEDAIEILKMAMKVAN